MRLHKFDIRYYRSIKKASVSDIDRVLILIGANNEGKSNILRAVRLALSVMQDVRYYRLRGGRVRLARDRAQKLEQVDYDWERDFPVGLQNHATLADKATVVRLTFQLSKSETEQFKAEFELNINGTIPAEVIFREDELEVKVVKQGPSAQQFQDRSERIARFISERLRFVYVPAVRTSRVALDIIEETIRNRVRTQQLPIIRQVEAELRVTEAQVLQEIEEELSNTLSSFIPDISAVKIESLRQIVPFSERGGYEVKVNDGHLTSISSKGDGVQSLVSLALMRSGGVDDGSTIYAIEEPEAHLNSEAIYKLKEAVVASGSANQVILTTHSPIFAYSGKMSSNIIVRASKATPAASISEIRQALGVRVPENLVSAGGFLLVEGVCEVEVFKQVLLRDERLQLLLQSGFLRIEPLRGASSLIHNCRHFTQLSCETFAFLDHDNDGRAAFIAASGAGYISADRVRYTLSEGRVDCELEDMFREESFAAILAARGMAIDAAYSEDQAKWTIRTQRLAGRCGVPWSSGIEEEIKIEINQALQGDYWAAMSDRGRIACTNIMMVLRAGIVE